MAELKPGTRIVSNFFDLGDWEPDSTSQVGVHSVHYWVVPADVGGTWNLTVAGAGAERRYVVRLTQRYQRLTGAATANGHTLPPADMRLVGDSIAFALTDTVGGRPVAMRFSGRASSDGLTGTVATAGSAEQRACGGSPGVLATGLSALLANYFPVSPLYVFEPPCRANCSH